MDKTTSSPASSPSPASQAVNTKLLEIQSGIGHLDGLIKALKESPGTLSVEDEPALDQIWAASANLVINANDLMTVAGSYENPRFRGERQVGP